MGLERSTLEERQGQEQEEEQGQQVAQEEEQEQQVAQEQRLERKQVLERGQKKQLMLEQELCKLAQEQSKRGRRRTSLERKKSRRVS